MERKNSNVSNEIFNAYVSLADYTTEADKNADTFGRTDLYTTGFPELDEWMSGGFGVRGASENFTIFGPSGCGKSTLALQFMKQAVIDGIPQAWIILEDDPVYVNARFRRMFDSMDEANKAINQEVTLNGISFKNPVLMPEEFVMGDFKLHDVYDWVASRIDDGIKLFLLDHIQYVFDAAEESLSSKANQEQRKFLKKLADLIKRNNATIVMVSHTNKDKNNRGMDRMYGSSAIAQTVTKNLEIEKTERLGVVKLTMHKNRHARDAMGNLYLVRDDLTVPVGGEITKFGFTRVIRSLDED